MALYNEQTGGIAREVECEVITVLGDNKYELSFSDETLTAVAKNTSDKYAVGEIVVVGLPQSEEEETIYILRKAESEPSGGVEASDEEVEKQESPLTNNFIPIVEYKYDNEIIMSNTYLNSDNKNISANPIDTTHQIVNLLKQQYNIIKMQCKIKTNIPDSLDTKYGEYGIVFRIPIKKDGKSEYKEFFINSDNVYGNPYQFNDYAEQSIIYKWEKDIEYDIDAAICPQFYTYVKDFNNDTEYTISIKDISFSIGYISSVIADRYNLYLSPTDGLYFKSNTDSTKTITPILYFNNEKVTDFTDKEIFWYREDYSMNPENINYSEDAGAGWRCINDYRIVGKKRIYTSQETIEIKAAGYLSLENKIRCIIKKKTTGDKIIENTISIYNNTNNIVLLECKVFDSETNIIQQDRADIQIEITFKEGNPFSSKGFWGFIKDLFTGNLKKIKASRYDKNNNYIDSNISFERIDTNKFLSNRIPVNSINDKNTFKITCSNFDEDAIYSNTSLTIEVINEPLYKLEIIGDKKNFKYDNKDNSPMSKDYADKTSIIASDYLELSYNLYDYKGNKIEDSEELTQKWKVDENNSLIEVIENGKTLKYRLKDKFDFNKSNINPVELIVTYRGQEIRKKAEITFSAEGSEGTYGKDCVIRLVPAKDFPSLDYLNNYYNEKRPIKIAYYKEHLYYYDYNENRFVSEYDQKIRFYPVLWDKHNFINPSNYSNIKCSIVESDKEKEEDRLKDKNYTNTCLKIDEYIDNYNGFTISLKKEPSKINASQNDIILKNYSGIYYYQHEHDVYDYDDDEGYNHYSYACYLAKVGYDYDDDPIYEHYPVSDYNLKNINGTTYIYSPNIFDKYWYNVKNNKLQNVNIIKVKMSYGGNSYEYYCPIEFYNTEVHPEFLPVIKGYNEVYFNKKEDGKPNEKPNANKPINSCAYKENIISNKDIFKQSIEPKSIFNSAINSGNGYNLINSDSYITTEPRYNESKRQFQEIVFRLSKTNELIKLSNIKKQEAQDKKEILAKENKFYQNNLNALAKFAEEYKAKDWLEKLNQAKLAISAKNNLYQYLLLIKDVLEQIEVFFDNEPKLKEDSDCKNFIEINSQCKEKVNRIKNKIDENSFISDTLILVTSENFRNESDLSSIKYNWDKYEYSLSLKHDLSLLSQLKFYIDEIEDRIKKYQSSREYFLTLENVNFIKTHENILASINTMNSYIEKLIDYKEIYDYINEMVNNKYAGIDNINGLYTFIKELYNKYLKYIFDLKEDESIVLNPKKKGIYENLICKNDNAISYYEDLISFCKNNIENNNNYNYFIRFNKPIIYHVIG